MPNTFNRAASLLLSGALDLSSANLAVLLLQGIGYVYNPDHDFVADLNPGANEVSVAGYARQTLAGLAVNEDDANNRATAEALAATFSSLTAGQTITAAVVFVDTGDDATSTLVAFYTISPLPTTGVDVVVRFDGSSPGDFLRAVN